MRRLATALVAAVIMGSGAIAPVHAQSFGIFFGDEKSDFSPYVTCLTDYQIRQDIAARGYTDIALNVANEPSIEVRATKGGWVYLLDFNYCTREIEGRQRLRAAG